MNPLLVQEKVELDSIFRRPTKDYSLQCIHCGKKFDDDGVLLSCNEDHPPSFLKSIYSRKKLILKSESTGIYKFADWMPISHQLNGSSAPVTYKSENLAKLLGLENLFISFNGYWPEKGGNMMTGTFKECEAFTVCARLPKDFNDILVLASTGNTARAFAKVCSDNNIKLLLVVPESLTKMLWFKKDLSDNVKLIAVGGNGDYYDAMKVADLISNMQGFTAEGGGKNVARRDGMGTTVLSAVTTAGLIPDYYFQAVGSGAGAIAAWEENLRLIESGQYGDKKMKLIISQNFPFTPIVHSWQKRTRSLINIDEEEAKKQIAEISAKVLANRNPTYSIHGGVYDALTDTKGHTVSITNEEASAASKLFEEQEGIDILPPAAVATASLIKYCKAGVINKGEAVLLNVTGGGIKRFKRDNHLSYLKPCAVIDKSEISEDAIKLKIEQLYR